MVKSQNNTHNTLPHNIWRAWVIIVDVLELLQWAVAQLHKSIYGSVIPWLTSSRQHKATIQRTTIIQHKAII